MSTPALINVRMKDGLVHVVIIRDSEGERYYYRLLCEEELSYDVSKRGQTTLDAPTCVACSSPSRLPWWHSATA